MYAFTIALSVKHMKLLSVRSAAFVVAIVSLLMVATFAFAEEAVPVSESVESEVVLEESTDIQVITEEDLILEEAPAEPEVIIEAESIPIEKSVEVQVEEQAPEETAVEADTTPVPVIWTDKADYAPTDEATIFGKYFSSVYTFLLKIVGGFEDGSENVTFTDTVTTDDKGSFIYRYLLDGIYRPFYTAKALVIDAGDVIASVDFTDSNPQAVTLNPTSNTVVVGASSANYVATVTVGGNSNPCTLTFSILSLPSGVTATFSGGSTASMTNVNITKTFTLNTTNTTPVGTHSFSLKVVRGADCQGSGDLTTTGTLVVNTAAPTTVSITGIKFKDLDADGAAREAGEPTLSGWTIRLYNTATTPWTLVDTKVTDSNGAYAFATVPSGNYKICEVLQSGWIQTFASTNGGNSSPNASQEGPECVTRNVTPPTTPDAANFGNFEKVNLTITASSPTITYGAAIPTITPTYNGLITGDTAPDTLPVCTTTATASANAGTYSTSCTGAADPKYNITYMPGTLTIDKAPSMTAVTCPASVVYNGATQTPCSTSVTGAGGLSLTPSPTYTNNTNVGTASASYTYAGDANHTGSSDTETFEITKASSVTDVICPASVVYDGTAQTPCTVSVTGAGGLSVASNPLYKDNISVGTMSASFTYEGDDNHSGSSDSESFEITPAPSTTTVTCPTSVTYTGSAQTPCSTSVTGVGGLSLTLSPTYINNTNVGTASASYIYLGDANHAGSSDTETFDITKAASATVVTCSPISVVYNGTAQTPCSTSVTGAGGLSLTPDPVYTNNTNAGIAGAAYTYTGDTNHTGSSDTETFEITPAVPSCTVTGDTVVYDGAAHGASGSCLGVRDETLAGLDLGGSFTDVPGGTANWTFTDETGNYEDTSGTAEIIITPAAPDCTVSGYTGVYDGDAHGATGACLNINGNPLTGLDLGASFTDVPGGTANWTFTSPSTNYSDQSGTAAIVITKANPSCDVDGYLVTYNGNPHTATGNCVGVKGETLSGLDLTGTTHTNAGTYTDSWSFTGSTNYNATSGSVIDTISKADATCTVSGTTVTYNGNAHGATGSCLGVNDETLAGLDLGGSFTDVPGGTANWTFTDETGNYEDTSGTASIVINKATATCTVTGYTVTYDGLSHTATGGCTGIGAVSLSGLDLSATVHTNVGIFTDTWTFTDVTGNYHNTSGNVTDTINAAALTLTAQPATKQYSDPLPTLTGLYTGFVNGETAAVLSGALLCTTTGTQFSPVGTYPINCSGQTATNYTITPVPGTLTVTPENTAISYSGETFVMTAGPSITSAAVPLSASLVQEVDAGAGNITLAKVTFTLVPVGAGSTIFVPNVPVDSTGKAVTTKTVPVGTYDITVTISSGNQYWVAAPAGVGTLNVAIGSTEQRVTGGGWITDLASLNDKDNYGFTVNHNKSGTPKGNFLFMFRGEDGYDYKLKNNSWSQGGLSFLSATKAYFSGKATLSKIDQQTGLVVSSDGSYTFGVTITDGGSNKTTPDSFAITIYNSTGGVWKQLGPLAPGGGNIVIHSN